MGKARSRVFAKYQQPPHSLAKFDGMSYPRRMKMNPTLAFLLLSSSIATAQTWFPTNGPYGGDVRCIAFNNATGHVFVGTQGGGVFRSVDNGDYWGAVNS